MDRRLVDHLVNSKLVSRAAMQRIILRATKNKTSVIEQLFEDGKVDEEAVAGELADYYGMQKVEPGSFTVNETALKFISKSMADKHGVLPFAVSAQADQVSVAVYNPDAARSVVDSLKTATGKEPTVQVAARGWLTHAIRHFYFGEAWANAPAHNSATRDVGDISDDVAVETTESSAEIVLDEVIMPPRPKKKKKAPTPEAKPPPTPAAEPEPAAEQPRRRKRSGSKSGRRRTSSGAGADSEAQVEAALDEFDAFLDSATGWGTGGRAKIPGWDEESEAEENENPFANNIANSSGWGNQSGSGFNLFDEQSESGESADLRDLLDEHEDVIERLRRELQQQRDIISALVDALADAGVVTKRDIKHRVKRK